LAASTTFEPSRENFEQLHLRLNAQEVADVLTYLRNVFRDQQSDREVVVATVGLYQGSGGSAPPARYQDGPFVMVDLSG
jgi:hypothetical protein